MTLGTVEGQGQDTGPGNAHPHNGDLAATCREVQSFAPHPREAGYYLLSAGALPCSPPRPHLLPLPRPQPLPFSGPVTFQKGSGVKASWQLSGVSESKLISSLGCVSHQDWLRGVTSQRWRSWWELLPCPSSLYIISLASACVCARGGWGEVRGGAHLSLPGPC